MRVQAMIEVGQSINGINCDVIYSSIMYYCIAIDGFGEISRFVHLRTDVDFDNDFVHVFHIK